MVPTGLLRVLVAVSFASCAYGNYFIACPNTFRPETPFSCEISYTTSETVNVEVTLGREGYPPLQTQSKMMNERSLITLNIPKNVTDGTYTLTVVGRRPDNSELFRNSTIVQDNSDNSLLFIQIDKPMYKPLQTVKFRIVCVDQELKPRTELTDISVFDQNGNILQEWLAVSGQNGVIEETYTLSDLPPLGEWRIQAKNKVAMTSKTFVVDKYVLPKFEVTAEATPTFLITGEGGNGDFTVKVKAKFTFGKNVNGKATFIFGEGRVMTETSTLKYDENGVHSQVFSLSTFNKVQSYNSLKFSVNVTDTSTLVTQSSNQVTIKLHDRPTKMEFLPTSTQVFRPGSDVDLKIKLTNLVDNSPAHTGMIVAITSYIGGKSIKRNITINGQGIAETSFKIPENVKNEYGITFSANLKTPKYILYGSHSVLPYRAKLNTTVTLTLTSSQPIPRGGVINIAIKASGNVERMAYLVLARGVVVDSGPIVLGADLTSTQTISTSQMMAPQANVVVYGIVRSENSYEVIADSVEVQVEGIFDNDVSLSFSTDRTRVGQSVDVTVQSAPNSKYFILAVDKSVMLLGTGNDLARTDVTERVKKFSLGKTRNYNDGPEPHHDGGAVDFIMPRPGGGTNDAPTSAGQIFADKGLLYLSGIIVEAAPPDRPIIMEDRLMFNRQGDAESAVDAPAVGGSAKTEYAEVGRVRKSFPEAWMWKDGMIKADGSDTFPETVPDTITEWQATAFTMSNEKGLAITSEPSKLIAFQPFFVSMTLPYAIKRGEIFQLRVTVNNYIEPRQDTAVKVTLKQSNDFGVFKMVDGKNVTVSEEVVEEIMVKSNIPGLVIFDISAKKLGDIKLEVVAQPDKTTGEKGDSLVRTVMVKPEGIVQRKVEGETAELDDTTTVFKKNISVVFPQNRVPDSERLEVKVTGDVMGPTVDGLESLIRMPTGCGEQNMITLVPNIVVYIYLNNVNRMTLDIEKKAVNNMKAGYQRELTYLRKDGSFSAFGESDKNGSTWLTAFVMKCFSQAKNEITVDPNIMKGAFKFVKSSQNKDGTFNLIGNVIHKEMLGGSAEGKRAATAFIYIALKESESFLSMTDQSAMTKALLYLENLVAQDKLNSTYEMAIVAYALALADSNQAKPLLDKIEQKEKPWEKTKPDEPVAVPLEGDAKRMIMPPYPPKATSSDVETWSYVLLAYVERKDIVLGRPIMKWLLSQQNGLGGFFSTQDTVLGLQALAQYASLVYEAPQTDITLNIRSARESHAFYVQNDQLLLLQSFKFTYPTEANFIELTATGRGLALVKILWQYNTMEEEKTADKDKIITEVVPEKINEELYRIKTCFKSREPNLGMMLMTLDKQTQMSLANMEELEQNAIIKRVEEDRNSVHLYFDEATSEFQCANVNMQRDSPVMNMKAAAMKVVAYYQPEVEVEKMYTIASAEQVVDICEICLGNACPDVCIVDKCKNCGRNCPSECDTSGTKTWKYDGMLLAMAICFLLSFIMAM